MIHVIKNMMYSFIQNRVHNFQSKTLTIDDANILMCYLHFNKKYNYVAFSKDTHEHLNHILESYIYSQFGI